MWRKVEEKNVTCFEYRRNIKTSGRTEYLIYSRLGRIEPLYTRRSRSGAHGEDCYRNSDIEDAIVMIKIEVSSSGKDYSTINVKSDTIPLEVMKQIIHDLSKFHPSIYHRLANMLSNYNIS